jgi:adenine C2-methylase RlmN of 23S rRNA A2503 and tRNA A37
MLFDIMNLVRGLGGVEETWDALNYFREQTVKAGFPGLELHLTVRRDSHMAQKIDEKSGMTVLEFINKTGFDGVTHYGFLDFVNIKQNYADVLVDVEKGYKKTAEQVNSIYYPNVSMGWDTTPRYPHREDDNICTETTPENIKKGFELAKKYVDETKGLKAPLIIVNSWNEWTEGTYIQPDNINGYGYLKALKEVFLDK